MILRTSICQVPEDTNHLFQCTLFLLNRKRMMVTIAEILDKYGAGNLCNSVQTFGYGNSKLSTSDKDILFLQSSLSRIANDFLLFIISCICVFIAPSLLHFMFVRVYV